MKKIVVLNGPNLNLLAKRNPSLYGGKDLVFIQQKVEELLLKSSYARDIQLSWRQSNNEASLIDDIQQLTDDANCLGLVMNPAGLTHSSVALYDALELLPLPFIEVHLSNIHRREDFRQKRLTTQAAWGVIEGMGGLGYWLAIEALCSRAHFE